jgi:hypothetical protein
MRTVSSYLQTSVHWGKSQADICKLLGKQGIKDTRFTVLNSENKLICEFNYPTKIEEKSVNIGVRIVLPLPEAKDPEKAKNQIHRALFYYLKTKFEALNFGLVEFIQEFMPHLVIHDSHGGSGTIFQIVGPQYKKGIKDGKQGAIKLLTEDK